MRTSHYKNKVLLCAGALLAFVLVNYAIFHYVTEDLITNVHFDGGDIARLGYLPEIKLPRHTKVTLPKVHLQFKDYQSGPLDMVTIGDSFANGGGGGENSYFQDYLASFNNMSVLNLDHYKDVDMISTVAILLNNGFLDRARPRFLMICATEKGLKELNRDVDFSRTATMEQLRGFKLFPQAPPPKTTFINNGNFKYLVNKASYSLVGRGQYGGVYLSQLDRDLFSVAKGRRLAHLRYKPDFSEQDVIQLNENMNRLADLLRARGIRLVYMPYVDKYTLYSKWLPKKRFPESTFFEMLRPLPKHYRFIDTKAILREAVEEGEKDIFYPDDTHASWKASQRIFSRERFDAPEASPATAKGKGAGPVQ